MFCADDDYKGFLRERVGADNNAFKPGNFVNTKGEVLVGIKAYAIIRLVNGKG